MADEIDQRMAFIKQEMESRKKQLAEIRFNYDYAKRRLADVETQLQQLEQQYELLAQGQLPLDLTPDLE